MRTRSPYTVSVRYKRRRIDTDTPETSPAATPDSTPATPSAASPATPVIASATVTTAALRMPPREEHFSEQLRGPYGNSMALRQAISQMQADMDAMGFNSKPRR